MRHLDIAICRISLCITDNDISLDDLSDLTGVERRTLRSWVADGLLSAPLKVGRGALYPRANVDRAMAVRALREIHGLPRTAIRARLLLADDRDIRQLAEEAHGLVAAGRSVALQGPSSARAYLAQLREPAPEHLEEPAQQMRMPSPIEGRPAAESRPDAAGIDALLSVLEGSARVPSVKRLRGTNRYHIPITPDLELSVRGEISPRDRVMLERVADLIRAILTGGLSHDDK